MLINILASSQASSSSCKLMWLCVWGNIMNKFAIFLHSLLRANLIDLKKSTPLCSWYTCLGCEGKLKTVLKCRERSSTVKIMWCIKYHMERVSILCSYPSLMRFFLMPKLIFLMALKDQMVWHNVFLRRKTKNWSYISKPNEQQSNALFNSWGSY